MLLRECVTQLTQDAQLDADVLREYDVPPNRITRVSHLASDECSPQFVRLIVERALPVVLRQRVAIFDGGAGLRTRNLGEGVKASRPPCAGAHCYSILKFTHCFSLKSCM